MKLTANKVAEFVGIQGDLSVSGKITKVWERKSGVGEKGAWSFQGFVLKDDTGEMQCTLKNRQDVFTKDLVGKSVTISSNNTEKGWFGVKVNKESYDKDGKTIETVKVVITKSATVAFGSVPTPPPPPPHQEQLIANPDWVTTPEQIPDPGFDPEFAEMIARDEQVKQTTKQSAPIQHHNPNPAPAMPTHKPQNQAEHAPQATIEQIRRLSWQYSWTAIYSVIGDVLNNPEHPAYKEAWSAAILACGRNSDTAFIQMNKQ